MKNQQKRLYELFKNRGPMPKRPFDYKGDGESAQVGDWGVAVTGNGGTAQAGLFGAAIGGDGASATCSGLVALAGEEGLACVGDGAMARVGYRGKATGQVASVAYVHPGGWAHSNKMGIAVALGGLSETALQGIAVAYSYFSELAKWRGIAIAGAGGVAVAMTDGSFVQAGVGGVLLGCWGDAKNIQRIAVRTIKTAAQAASIFRFANGRFQVVAGSELVQAQADIAAWRKAGPKPKPGSRRRKRDVS